ncbi:MAG: hypothetical protein OXM01_09890 [Gemmatimonadota bacterium]|nr:hypothetical protein [Gemmatimonadota bacterium]
MTTRISLRRRRSRADIVRQALERYLEDLDDLSVALERLQDPADPVLDWDQLVVRIAHRREVYRRR